MVEAEVRETEPGPSVPETRGRKTGHGRGTVTVANYNYMVTDPGGIRDWLVAPALVGSNPTSHTAPWCEGIGYFDLKRDRRRF